VPGVHSDKLDLSERAITQADRRTILQACLSTDIQLYVDYLSPLSDVCLYNLHDVVSDFTLASTSAAKQAQQSLLEKLKQFVRTKSGKTFTSWSSERRAFEVSQTPTKVEASPGVTNLLANQFSDLQVSLTEPAETVSRNIVVGIINLIR
jgi:hypothetical protein